MPTSGSIPTKATKQPSIPQPYPLVYIQVDGYASGEHSAQNQYIAEKGHLGGVSGTGKFPLETNKSILLDRVCRAVETEVLGPIFHNGLEQRYNPRKRIFLECFGRYPELGLIREMAESCLENSMKPMLEAEGFWAKEEVKDCNKKIQDEKLREALVYMMSIKLMELFDWFAPLAEAPQPACEEQAVATMVDESNEPFEEEDECTKNARCRNCGEYCMHCRGVSKEVLDKEHSAETKSFWWRNRDAYEAWAEAKSRGER